MFSVHNKHFTIVNYWLLIDWCTDNKQNTDSYHFQLKMNTFQLTCFFSSCFVELCCWIAWLDIIYLIENPFWTHCLVKWSKGKMKSLKGKLNSHLISIASIKSYRYSPVHTMFLSEENIKRTWISKNNEFWEFSFVTNWAIYIYSEQHSI